MNSLIPEDLDVVFVSLSRKIKGEDHCFSGHGVCCI